MATYVPREWDLTVWTTERLPEGMKNWPSHMYDQIFNHLRKWEKELDEKLYVEQSRTGTLPEGHFVHLRVKNVPPAGMQKSLPKGSYQ